MTLQNSSFLKQAEICLTSVFVHMTLVPVWCKLPTTNTYSHSQVIGFIKTTHLIQHYYLDRECVCVSVCMDGCCDTTMTTPKDWNSSMCVFKLRYEYRRLYRKWVMGKYRFTLVLHYNINDISRYKRVCIYY